MSGVRIDVNGDDSRATAIALDFHVNGIHQVGCESSLCRVSVASSAALCTQECERYIWANDDPTVDDPAYVVRPLKARGIGFEFGDDEAGVVLVGDPS